MKLAEYRKGLIAVLTAIVTIGVTLPPEAPDWASRAVALAGALLVLLVPNAPTAAQRAAARFGRQPQP